MRVALLGWHGSGKTTVMEALAGGRGAAVRERSGLEYRVGTAPVPDTRLDYLVELYRPRKTTPASLEFADLPGLSPRGMENSLLETARGAEAFVFVLRAFSKDGEDPARDYLRLEEELLLADLSLVEKRLDRLAHQGRPSGGRAEARVLERCRAHLEAGNPLRTLELAETGEAEVVASYRPLTRKPTLAVVNIHEGLLPDPDGSVAHLREEAETRGAALVSVCASLEAEISALPVEERAAFLGEFGLNEPGIARVARAAFSAAGLISFFTVGADEVKAWVLTEGTTAWEAAGKIHTDIMRGFIRAEVVAFEDLQRAGSIKAAKADNRVRLEGKEYVVRDGDVIEFRFNV